MKKLVLFAVVAISFASCTGSSSKQTTPVEETVPATVVEEVEAIIPDSVNGDTTVVEEVTVETVK